MSWLISDLFSLHQIKKQMVERIAERERLERQVKGCSQMMAGSRSAFYQVKERKEEVAMVELKLSNMTRFSRLKKA